MRFVLAVALGALFAAAPAADAQTMYGPTIGLSQSLSHTKDFADDFSIRNLSGEVRTMLGGRTALGVSIGWHVFHEEEELATDVTGTTFTATGLQYRTVNAIPMTVGLYRYFGEARTDRWYVGAAAGGTYTRTRLDLGIVGVSEDAWGFSVIPEVGYLKPFKGFTELSFSAKYLYASGDLGAQAIVLSVGVMSWPFLSGS